VRIDLDKTYLPGQTFNIKFTVLQGNLLERLPEQNQWRIAYTPAGTTIATSTNADNHGFTGRCEFLLFDRTAAHFHRRKRVHLG